MHQIVAEVWRGEFAESVHHGSVIGLAEDGTSALIVGAPERVIYPRSANKPAQALGMLRAGLDLDGQLLALACASHSGERFHITGVRRILAAVGLTENDLRCTADLPIDCAAKQAHLTAGHGPAPLHMNCSGKHAAMLATCVHNGWPTANYLHPSHPVQLAIRDAVADLAGERISHVGVDGCGAPLYGLTLIGVARTFRRLASAPRDELERRIASAMSTYPQWVGGTGRDVTTLMRVLPGSVAKDGAEGVFAIGLPNGRAAAVKIADGASRARTVALVAALKQLGEPTAPLAELAEQPVLGHGVPVGAVRPAGPLARWHPGEVGSKRLP